MDATGRMTQRKMTQAAHDDHGRGRDAPPSAISDQELSLNRMWVLPALLVVAGILAALGLSEIDKAAGYDLVPASVVGTATTAQQVLSLIAQAVLSLATVVLSLTLVAVQLAMGQFSPRIVRAMQADRRNQAAIGVFLATFAYAMLAMREVDDQHDRVPGLTVLVAYLLGLACVVGLLVYIHQVSQSLRVAGIIDLVGDETCAQLERLFPPDPDALRSLDGAPDLEVVPAVTSGVVVQIDRDALVEAARAADTSIELVPMMGDFVPTGAPLARTGRGVALEDAVRRHVRLARERTHEHDPAFGIRKLVDIAERASSDPFDDPTTTVQAIDRLHECLRLLAGRRLPSGRYTDAAGAPRLLVRELQWPGYVRLAFDEVRLVAAQNPQTARRLRAALDDLLATAPEERRPPLERQLRLLEAAVTRNFDDDADADAAATPDAQGIGSGPDLVSAPWNGGRPADSAWRR
jgi:uncharacterized membrane protein